MPRLQQNATRETVKRNTTDNTVGSMPNKTVGSIPLNTVDNKAGSIADNTVGHVLFESGWQLKEKLQLLQHKMATCQLFNALTARRKCGVNGSADQVVDSDLVVSVSSVTRQIGMKQCVLLSHKKIEVATSREQSDGGSQSVLVSSDHRGMQGLSLTRALTLTLTLTLT